MFNFLFTLEIITMSNASDFNVDIDVDTHTVIAENEEYAMETLRERINYSSEYFSRYIRAFQCHGTLEDENF